MQPTGKGPLSPLSPHIQAHGGQTHSSPPNNTSSRGRHLKAASGRFGTSTHSTLGACPDGHLYMQGTACTSVC